MTSNYHSSGYANTTDLNRPSQENKSFTPAVT